MIAGNPGGMVQRVHETRPSSFMVYHAPWAQRLFSPLAWLYDRAYTAVSGPAGWRSEVTRDHFLFFLVTIAVLIPMFPRYFLILTYGFERVVLGTESARIESSGVPHTPGDLPLYLLLFLGTFFVRRSRRMVLLFLVSIPVGFLAHRLDLPSLAVLIPYFGLTYLVLRLPFPKIATLTLVCLLSFALPFACAALRIPGEWSLTAVAFFQPLLLPALWWSAYEELPPKKRLSCRHFMTYMYLRFFMMPLATYAEVFTTNDKSLSSIRFGGVKALFVALCATIGEWLLGGIEERFRTERLTGLALLIFSYLFYLRSCCGLVILFNSVTGVLRLFGIPVRDSFNYWLLARTPNEHWRRWNMLMREWIVGFVFFPLMRAKRGLFLAVMAALCTSGLLHLSFELRGAVDGYRVAAVTAYWILNGLAIYAVLKIPLLFPGIMTRLGVGRLLVWDVFGLILTSAFYAVIQFARENTRSWVEFTDYLGRLGQIGTTLPW